MKVFAVTDIETTGGQARGNDITEIAVVLTDGDHEIDRFHSLVQPDQPIPHYITSLTGITNEMVYEAPKFEELADELLSFYEDAIFVAHNVGFDYSFLKKAFDLNGRMFNPPRLCTVRISRKVFPGLPSYSLGALCRHFNISNPDAHRALSDTLATVELLKKCLAQDDNAHITAMLKRSAPEQWLPPALPPIEFQRLPESPGVYYFHKAGGEVLYIGMSHNIKKRVRQHFGGPMDSAKRQSFLRDIHSISFESTGSLLIARLLEDAEIRKHRPPFNKAQKRKPRKYYVVRYVDQVGYIRLTIADKPLSGSVVNHFFSLTAARDWLYRFARKNDIDLMLCGLMQSDQKGVSVNMHNSTMVQALDHCDSDDGYKYITGEGRSVNEHSVIVVKGKSLVGYTYYTSDEAIVHTEELHDRLKTLPESEMSASILQQELESVNQQ